MGVYIGFGPTQINPTQIKISPCIGLVHPYKLRYHQRRIKRTIWNISCEKNTFPSIKVFLKNVYYFSPNLHSLQRKANSALIAMKFIALCVLNSTLKRIQLLDCYSDENIPG